MSYHLKVSEKATSSIYTSIEWYEHQQPGLGSTFYSQLKTLFIKICTYPKHFPQHNPPFREAYLKKFPYVILYEIENDTIFIYQVFNTHQDPKQKYYNTSIE